MGKIRVGIIGNGIAGFSAASTIRRLDHQVDLTIISTERVPVYSACVLPDYIAGKISRENVFVKTKEDYEELGIHMLLGYEVIEVDPVVMSITLHDGKVYTFDRLILALGSDPIGLGEFKEGIFKIKRLSDAEELLWHNGRRAIVVGSGPIGVEIAIALHTKLYKVTIIEMAERVLPLGLDEKAAMKVKRILEEKGINVLTGERAIEVVGLGHVEGLVTDKHALPCDTLIWAIGMRPNVKLAAKAGIKAGVKGGIKVDAHMETNFQGIYACGDCVETNDVLIGNPSLNLFWHNAKRQGSVAALNCMGITKEYAGSQSILNIDVFGNHIVGFGFTEESMHGMITRGALNGTLGDLSIIEEENNESYCRMLIFKDRCVGGQFVNLEEGLGLLWSMMSQGRSIMALLRVLENRELMRQRPWLYRVKPYFVGH